MKRGDDCSSLESAATGLGIETAVVSLLVERGDNRSSLEAVATNLGAEASSESIEIGVVSTILEEADENEETVERTIARVSSRRRWTWVVASSESIETEVVSARVKRGDDRSSLESVAMWRWTWAVASSESI